VPGASPASPVLSLNLIFGMVAGLLVGLALAVGMERLDQRIRTAAEAEEALGLPVIGVVPRFPRKVKERDAMARHADPKLAGPFGNLAIGLASSAHGCQHRTILITSVSPGDGKTTVAAHLALSLAHLRRPSALIEADLREPSVGTQFPSLDMPSRDEIRSLGASLPTATRALPHLNVFAATADDDPTSALQSTAFRRVLEVAQRNCDLVLLDGPPALPNADVSILAQYADTVVIVVRADETRADDCRELVVALKRLGADVAGIVVTHARRPRRTGYYGSGRPAIATSGRELKAVGEPLAS
jgi:Mrp family chromosome partitioning ATPase